MNQSIDDFSGTKSLWARSFLYGFLATVYRSEPNYLAIRLFRSHEFLRSLEDLGVHLEESFLQKGDNELIEILGEEYTRIFCGPGKHVSPYESVYTEKNASLWGPSTVAVKKFIESNGFALQSSYRGIPDHISVELEFMQKMVRQSGIARRNDKPVEEQYYRHTANQFVEEHLSRWIPSFCHQVMEYASVPFYEEMARLTRDFIELEGMSLH